LPFGNGPRKCLGINFSITEQTIFITELLMNYQVSFVDKNQNIEQDPNKFIANGAKKVPIRFKRIKN
jgi:cytochrome P450